MSAVVEEEEESPATRDPLSLTLRIGDTLEAHADEIDRAYRAYSAMRFTVAMLAVIVTLFVVAVWTTLSLQSQVIFGSLDAVIIGLLAYAFRAEKGFSLVDEIRWEVDRFKFITTLELLPPTSHNPPERLWNALKEASGASEDLKTLLAEEIKFNAEVTGKSGKRYTLEVFVHKEPRNRLQRFLSKWTLRVWPMHFLYYHFLPNIHRRLHEDQLTILVKRFVKETPVSKSDLELVKKEFEDIGKRLRDVPEHAVVVSTSGFSDDALEYARDDESEIRPFADEEESAIMDLVVERNDGSFEVAYYG